MNQPDFFPLELAAAQRQLADEQPYEPEVTDDLALTEDDKSEPIDRYWYWDDSDYAQEVCQKRWGPL